VQDGVAKVTTGQKVRMHGVEVGGSMGRTTWAASSNPDELAAWDGDFIMPSVWLQPVPPVLRMAGTHVVALHNSMIGEEPASDLTHFCGEGKPTRLAEGLRSALDAQKDAGTPEGH
jgi:hypothetical protein